MRTSASSRRVPKLPEILGIALAVGVDAEQIGGFGRLHAVAHRPGIAFPLVAEDQPQREFFAQVREDLLGGIAAAVLADDDADAQLARQLSNNLTDHSFNRFGLIIDRQKDLDVDLFFVLHGTAPKG